MVGEDFGPLWRMWSDQVEFNNTLRELPTTHEGRTALTKDLVLHLHSETDELLRASGAWKSHRRVEVRENVKHINEELIDIFKLWLSLAHIYDLHPDKLEEEYFKKSRVVRQRHAQEWNLNLVGSGEQVVVIDIDNVIANYIEGFAQWAYLNGWIRPERANLIIQERLYVNASSLDITPEEYRDAKHAFRISGAHLALPVMPGARAFLKWVRAHGWRIILLTARPIDRYPNLHAETLGWLSQHNLPFDVVWWSADKGELIVDQQMRKQVMFAVDDEWTHVERLASQDITTYWLGGKTNNLDNVKNVTSFEDIQRDYGSGATYHGQQLR